MIAARFVPPPQQRCMDCGSPDVGGWLRCARCESIFQQEQRLYRVGP